MRHPYDLASARTRAEGESHTSLVSSTQSARQKWHVSIRSYSGQSSLITGLLSVSTSAHYSYVPLANGTFDVLRLFSPGIRTRVAVPFVLGSFQSCYEMSTVQTGSRA